MIDTQLHTEAIQSVDASIESLKQTIALADSFKRLSTNKDFKKLIIEEYLKNNAIRLVHLTTNTALNAEAIQNDIKGIAAFNQYLLNVAQAGAVAERELEEANVLKAELQEEMLNG